MKKILLIAAMFLTFGSAANAACTRADLTGSWVAYSTGAYSNAARTSFTVPAKGNVVSGTSLSANGVSGTGDFTITSFDKSCHFVGYSFDGTGTTYFDAYVSKGKDSMSGMWYESVGTNFYSGSFNASKQ